MCKLAFAKTKDGSAYFTVIEMLKHQENNVAGQSTGISWKDNQGVHLRRAIGKVNSFLAEFPEIPQTDLALGHSRFASVGVISVENQHPVKIMYKGKRIGYAVHNGTWSEYEKYENYRNQNLENKTDSQLIFTIYSLILEKYGDNLINRRRALATINKIVSGQSLKSFILVFDDGQAMASATTLTYREDPDKLLIMTFGLPNPLEYGYIYEVKGFKLNKYESMPFDDFVLTPKSEPKKPKQLPIDCCGPGKEAGDVRHIDDTEWVLVKGDFENWSNAKLYAQMLKAQFKQNTRVIFTETHKYGVYVKKRGF